MNQPVETPRPLPTPKEIIVRETGATVAYACPNAECGLLFLFSRTDTEEDKKRKYTAASKHCVKTCTCGQPLEYHYLLCCAGCRAKQEQQREQRAFGRAVRISMDAYPDHPVFWRDAQSGEESSGYFTNLDALCEYCEERGLDLPPYVWACYRQNFELDAKYLIRQALLERDINPDSSAAAVSPGAYAELQHALDTWTTEHADRLCGWFQDTSRVILLREDAENG